MKRADMLQNNGSKSEVKMRNVGWHPLSLKRHYDKPVTS